MKKISYRSREAKDIPPVKNLPVINYSDETATENAGRASFIMPGDIYPVSSGLPPEFEDKLNPDSLKKNLLFLKSKKLNKNEASFVSFMLKKVSEESEDLLYEKIFMKDMYEIFDSKEVRAMEIVNDLVIMFSDSIANLMSNGLDKKTALKNAYFTVKQKYPIKKTAQVNENDPKFVAKYVAYIILIMISKFSLKSSGNARANLRRRISNMNIQDMSNKKAPAGAAIGTSIALVKNILNGKDPYFIKTVIDEIQRYIWG